MAALKKIALLLIMLIAYAFVGLPARANDSLKASYAKECRHVLLGQGRFDSAQFSYDVDQFETRDYGRDYLARAIASIRYLIDQNGCAPRAVNFGDGPLGRSISKCQAISPRHPHSVACYIETNLGYFFVTWDMLENVNITFNRWD
jgi:hypothetical protein